MTMHHRQLVTPPGDKWIRPILTPWFLGPTLVSPQRASQLVQPFCMAHERDQQTDKQTDRSTMLLHLQREPTSYAILAMWPNKKKHCCVRTSRMWLLTMAWKPQQIGSGCGIFCSTVWRRCTKWPDTISCCASRSTQLCSELCRLDKKRRTSGNEKSRCHGQKF